MSAGTMPCAEPDAVGDSRAAAMQADAVLPAAIRPPGAVASVVRRVLLTGATGFLGTHVLRELLARGLDVHCLIRAVDDAEADVRLARTLDAAGVRDEASRVRAHAVRGDTAQPQLGLGECHARLAAAMDAVYHCAAEVSWVKSYALLRRTNVTAALEVLRFACDARAKPVLFVSSLAVCFTGGQEAVDEDTDLLPFVARMPLGYAQSKCVAEALLREAARRGLPVTIVRPGLLAGDTLEGRCNPGDVLSALIEGCVARGIALDIDWCVDSVPVDHCARVVAELGARMAPGCDVVHLRHQQPRHWREMVLWLTLFGYPVRLVPTDRWNEQMFGAAGKGGALSSYRRFFMGIAGGPRPFEAYIAAAQGRVDCERSRLRLAALGLQAPALDTPLLRRYVQHFARVGALPPQPWAATREESAAPDAGLRGAVAEALEAPGGFTWEPMPFDASGGILNEIATIRLGAQVGMRRFRLHPAGGGACIDVVVKAKARDVVLHDLLAQVADGCDPALGRAVRAHPQALGLRRSHLREAALYLSAPASLVAVMPRCYGVSEDVERGRWSVAMAHLEDAGFRDGARWPVGAVEAAISAAASIHGAWYGHAEALQSRPWAAPEIGAREAGGMAPLWNALADFSAPAFEAWGGAEVVRAQRAFIADIERWWDALARMPRTLIHNDFNSRNIALHADDPRRVTVLDWELARIGVPQHDLAELLCFTLPASAGMDAVAGWLELHRRRLAARARVEIDPATWRRGFQLALRQLLVERLPLYAVIHRFKPQPFLPRVVRNWSRLHAFASALEGVPEAA